MTHSLLKVGDEVVPVLGLLETSKGHLGTCANDQVRGIVTFVTDGTFLTYQECTSWGFQGTTKRK